MGHEGIGQPTSVSKLGLGMTENRRRTAVVLAGGEGRRLKPYTTVLPKPLMPLGQHPVLEIVLRQLALFGFSDVILAVGYLAQLIEAYVGDGSRFGVNVRYSREENRLGTAGPLRRIERLPDSFLVMNGDILTDMDFAALWNAHAASGAALTVASIRKTETMEFGVLDIAEDGRVLRYTEKPQRSVDISTGIYAVSRAALTRIPEDKPFDFPDLVAKLLDEGERVMAYKADCLWLDIGRIEDYELAVELYSSSPERFLGSLKPDTYSV
jgi:NDP-sugar pyrophosphorylase family protein